MNDPWATPLLEEVALRRQEAVGKRANDELEDLDRDTFERGLNDLMVGWVDYRGRPLPGFEPIEVRSAEDREESSMAERRRIEVAAIRQRRGSRAGS
jgi:hypothetical protein